MMSRPPAPQSPPITTASQRRRRRLMLVLALPLLSLAGGLHAADLPLGNPDDWQGRRCDIVGVAPLGATASDLMARLSEAFAEERPRVVSSLADGLSAFRAGWPSLDIGLGRDAIPDDVVLVYRDKPDRECLLSPPRAPRATVLHVAGLTVEELGGIDAVAKRAIDLVNRHCEVHRVAGGSLTALGTRRRALLDGVYRLSALMNVSGDSGVGGGGAAVLLCHGADQLAGECQPLATASGRRGSSAKGAEAWLRPAAANGCSASACERVAAPDRRTFVREYLFTSKPVVFVGGAKHWRAFAKWTHDYLLRAYGDKVVHVKLTPDGEYEGVERVERWRRPSDFRIPPEVLRKLPHPELVVVRPAPAEMKFAEFLDVVRRSPDSAYVRANASAYLEYSSLGEFAELEKDVEEMDFVRGLLRKSQTNIWLSDGNTLGKLHFDPYDNILCQISGRKELLLYEPHNNTRLYEGHIPEAQLFFDVATGQFSRHTLMHSTSMVMSPVDPKRPDLEAFPEFAAARPMRCVIDEGDVLYLPAFWWHEVQSFPGLSSARNLAVNFWYEPFFMKEFPCPECGLDINPLYYPVIEGDYFY